VNTETIPNKALSGAELKKIMMEKFAHLLHNDTMLGDYMAYGRISYDITLRMHIDNPSSSGLVVDTIASSPVGKNIISAMPEMEALESGPPLKGPLTNKSTASGSRVTHVVTSPNSERLAHELPVPVESRKGDGSIRTEQVKYPKQPPLDNVKLEDITAETKRELGVK
jgi:hypothetical protein